MKNKNKPHKHHSNKKLVFIHKSGGHAWNDGQDDNIERERKEADKFRQKKGK